MKARSWVSGLCFALLISNWGAVDAAENPSIAEKRAIYNQDQSNLLAGKEYAVALAHAGDFTQSLEIFKQLYAMYPNSSDMVMDYLVVLNWSGNNRAAVDLYKGLSKVNLPIYVKNSAAGSYYQLGEFQNAYRLYSEVAATGDRKAQIWAIQAQIRMGEKEKGYNAYNALLEKNPGDIDVYLSRAEMRMLAGQYAEATADYQQARSLIPQGEEGAAKRRQVEYGMAIAYIRAGDMAQAIILLKPYIDNGTSDIFMQGDYIFALRLNADYKSAIREGEKLWPDYGKVPNFGLQALGDSYLRTGQLTKAIKAYEHILTRDPNSKSVKLGLAYSRMGDGQLEKGAELYRQLLIEDPKLAELMLDDASDFMAKNRPAAAKALYQVVAEQQPAVTVYRQEMVRAFGAADMPRQAYGQSKALAKLPDGAVPGNAGMAEAAVKVGDYQTAGKAVQVLKDMHSESAVSQGAIATYDKRRRGGAEVSYSATSDYKGIETKQLLVTGDQSISGSYSVLAAAGHTRITDKNGDSTVGASSSSMTTRALGLQYKNMKYDVQAWLDNYVGSGTFNGYQLFSNYYLSDNTVINFGYGKGPVLDAQAMDPNNEEGFGRIMTTNYMLGLRRQVGAHASYSINAVREKYSDSNRVASYGLRYDKTLIDREKEMLDWFVYANRSSYKYQQIAQQGTGTLVGTVYESPGTRETYGTGLTRRLTIPKGYWEGTFTLEIGRDQPEPFEFTPNFRLEYGHNYSPNHLLVVGAEFGLRTNRLNDSKNLRFGYRQYDLRYQFAW